MIKPVTYQGTYNFKANLYALEVKSRFIDQSHADGFYSGYGSELAATIIDNTIRIGTGAFVIQGRMNEIESDETVNINIENGKVGYVCLRSETYHPSDENNCTLIVKTGTSIDAISLTQEDTYQRGAETSNKVYELPIYSFEMQDGNITSLTKLIKAVADYATIKKIVDDTTAAVDAAVNTANSAAQNANQAVATANEAKQSADAALSTAGQAKNIAEEAKNIVEPSTKVNIEQGANNANKMLGTDAQGNVTTTDIVTLGKDIKLYAEKDSSTGEISFVIEFKED